MSPLHQEKMRVAAPPEMVQQWILAPEKVLEYAPGPVDCGLFRPGEQVWIRLKTGVTLLEKVHEESTDNRTTVRVTASTLKRNPTSVTEIESNRLMTFYEDWDLIRADSGTQIQKTWRDLTKHKMRWMPFGWLIQRSAKRDAAALEAAWG